MPQRPENQQQRQQLLTIADRGTAEELFVSGKTIESIIEKRCFFDQKFLQNFHRRPFEKLTDVLAYIGAIDDQIDFIDCAATRYNVTPLIIAAGKGEQPFLPILSPCYS